MPLSLFCIWEYQDIILSIISSIGEICACESWGRDVLRDPLDYVSKGFVFEVRLRERL